MHRIARCCGFNSGSNGLPGGQVDGRAISGFAAGDVVTFSISGANYLFTLFDGNDNPLAPFAGIGSHTIPNGMTASYTVTGGADTTLRWFLKGNPATGGNPSHTVTASAVSGGFVANEDTAALFNGQDALHIIVNDQGNTGTDPGLSGDATSEEASATFLINVIPVNDVAAISGENAGLMTEDAAGDSGALTVSDVDDAENVFQPVTSVVDSFTVISLDGTANEVVTITGENDAPVNNGVLSSNATVNNASASGIITLSGSFSDIETSDTHVATVNWGDGTVTTVFVNQLADTLAGSHTYQNGGSDGGRDRINQTITASSINRIVAYLRDGDDNIQGGRGNDVLIGGPGQDDIKGGSGADILIGGTGKDNLQGGKGNDLIIGGSTANENNLAALDQALAEWTSGGLNSALSLFGTIVDDNEKDDLFGEEGDDYLHFGNGDKRKN
jgi:hypothetical protein